MNFFRAALLALLPLLSCLSGSGHAQSAPVAPPHRPAARTQAPKPPAGGAIQAIVIKGNQRIETGTIRSYMLVQPGDPFDATRIDQSLKTLYATGLFADVSLNRQGNDLVVTVNENPIVNRIVFEGNHKLTDEVLNKAISLRPRAVFTPALAAADRQTILEGYAKKGRYDARVDPKIIRLEQNRVDVVFEIHEGDATLTSRIAFVGNKAFDEDRLREVVSSREQAWWRFLSSSDQYDPDRLNYDRELLRRFYLKNGYVDFEVRDVSAELSPDRSAFFLTFTLNEGERYRVGKISINSQLRHIEGDDLLPDLQMQEGDWYDGDAVERTVDLMTEDVQSRGSPFVDIKPRIARDKEKHTVDLVFDVGEGPRVYVERIDIQGNTITQDKVIRREFRFAEGDAFNAAALKKSRTRIKDLGFFEDVKLSPSPGSASDKAIVTAEIEEKATGELSLGGGYSSDAGPLLDVGVHQKNLFGTGVDTGISGVVAGYRDSVDLSITDPYFLDRNLVAGADLFFVRTANHGYALYDEKRIGFALRAGWEYNDHLRQSVNYSLVDRDVSNIQQEQFVGDVFIGGSSYYIQQQAGYSLLSQVGQTFSIDYRDSRTDAHEGFLTRFGTDFAGAGGDTRYVRTKLDGSYYQPLDRLTGNQDWTLVISAGAGYFFNLGQQERIIDRFFLGGDNLRGFQAGGAGPHDPLTHDSLGGRLIYTQSTEVRFPLPISQDLGLSGRTFVDIGGLTGSKFESGHCFGSNLGPGTMIEAGVGPIQQQVPGGSTCPRISDSHAPRLGAGFGVSWDSPFGLINVDVTPVAIKHDYDRKQFFRFGFGTRF